MPTIQHRRATSAQWTAANPVLAAGEIGFELDTNAIKIGDGLTPWETLSYLTDESLTELVEFGRLSEAELKATYATKAEVDAAVTQDQLAQAVTGEPAAVTDSLVSGLVKTGELTASALADLYEPNRAKVARIATGDLDDITTNGVYRVITRANATLANHYPEANVLGVLEVDNVSSATGSYPMQRFTTWDRPHRIYVRAYGDGGWRPWHKIPNTDEVATIATASIAPAVSSAQRLDPDGFYAPAGAKLTTPTHDGSGQAVHPSVLHIPEGFGGYTYWMAMTPLPGGTDPHEDPNILASQDGTTWVVPAGLTNPLDDAPGNPQYNSDTHLAMGPNNTLWCFWRWTDRGSDPKREVIYARTSTDGVNWTDRQTILDVSSESGNELLSPSIEYDPAGEGSWHMWVVTQSSGTNFIRYRQTTNATGFTWGLWQEVTAGPLGNGRFRPWHLSIRKMGDRYVGLMAAYAMQEPSAPIDVLMLVGDHKLTFTISTEPVIQRVSDLHTYLYQSSMVPVHTPAGMEFDVFYSARHVPTNKWHTFRSRLAPAKRGIFRQAIESKLTAELGTVDTGWRNISANITNGWTGTVRIRRIGKTVHVEIMNLDSTNATNGTPFSIPAGFRTTHTVRRELYVQQDRTLVAADVYSHTSGAGSVQLAGHTAGNHVRGGFVIVTDQNPPTTLPGTAD